jgi:hypothetical protein
LKFYGEIALEQKLENQEAENGKVKLEEIMNLKTIEIILICQKNK